jgi:hypothetical protein
MAQAAWCQFAATPSSANLAFGGNEMTREVVHPQLWLGKLVGVLHFDLELTVSIQKQGAGGCWRRMCCPRKSRKSDQYLEIHCLIKRHGIVNCVERLVTGTYRQTGTQACREVGYT